ncbi:MAG: T9SS type A sorting domain-containing protein, partial [Gammaproteobacteria bacterium]|nr:T9SS type A sorting domain-containing protein [Gammaproteobacteria bacterium]NIX00930.1 T9SS type A sorting domain-containing protein [Phycisphaerae bacterium]
PQNFELNISNEGLSPEVGFTWRGRIYDAAGNFITQVIGSVSDTIAVNDTATVTSTTAWTPQESGIYQIQAITSLNTDQDRSNDTTMTINTGGGFYSQFYVAEEELVFSRRVDDAPADPTAGTLESLGFRVRSNTPPGVVTWHTGSDPRTGLPGALIVYDSLARPQDEELIIPNLDFSYMTSDVVLNFYGQSVAGFTYTRISVSVSNDGGHTWHDVWERRRGIDPQTGTNYGGPAFLRFLMNPAHVDITNYAAGESNVWVRFRYQGYFDESWVVWNIALSGKGLRAANLSGVTDIPNDNGKQVRLTWDASANDGQLNGVPITEYGVWRMVPASGTTMPVSNKVVEVENRKEMIRLANVSKIEPGTRVYSSATPESWDFIGTVTAHSDSIYNYVAPTLEDSVQTCFMISAHTANPQVFANSNTQCGMSIDNLAPNVPGNFASMVNDIGGGNFTVELSWDRNKDEDFRYYSLYKDGQLLEQLTDTAFVDSNVAQNQTVEYDLTATDFAGNESDPAELTVVVTGIGDDPNAIPTEFALDQNFPNPFNPTTTLQYALKENARVKLQIYNVLGQLVKTLIDENQTAGYKEVVWDGTNNQGLKVPSGIYIYRIKANDFVESRKMILMK